MHPNEYTVHVLLLILSHCVCEHSIAIGTVGGTVAMMNKS